MPPSLASSQYPSPLGIVCMATMGRARRVPAIPPRDGAVPAAVTRPVLVTSQWPAAPGWSSAQTGIPPNGAGETLKTLEAVIGAPSELVALTETEWSWPSVSGWRGTTTAALRESRIDLPRACASAIEFV